VAISTLAARAEIVAVYAPSATVLVIPAAGMLKAHIHR
jgi:hypothetical protein